MSAAALMTWRSSWSLGYTMRPRFDVARRASEPRRPIGTDEPYDRQNFPPPEHPPQPWSISNWGPQGHCAMCELIIGEMGGWPVDEPHKEVELQCCCCHKILKYDEVMQERHLDRLSTRLENLKSRRKVPGRLPRAERMQDPAYRERMRQAAKLREQRKKEERERERLDQNRKEPVEEAGGVPDFKGSPDFQI